MILDRIKEGISEYVALNRDLARSTLQMPNFNQDLLQVLISNDADSRQYLYGVNRPGGISKSMSATEKLQVLGKRPESIGRTLMEIPNQDLDKYSFSTLRSSANPTRLTPQLEQILIEIGALEFTYFDTPKTNGHTILQHYPFGQPLTPEIYEPDLTEQILVVLEGIRKLYKDTGLVVDLKPTYPRDNTEVERPFVCVPGLWVADNGEVKVSSTTLVSKNGTTSENNRALSNIGFMNYLEFQMGVTRS